jgi:succinyl-diaminopimelate desuccinylase
VTEVAERLAETTLALVDVPSESRREQAIAELVATRMPWGPAYRAGETLWYEAPGANGGLVVLAGHLDTVPAQGNLPGLIADGRVHGLGASDMKGGLAVMLELARWVASARPSGGVRPAFLFFPREELPQEESALPDLFAGCPRVREADLVVLLEPTDNELHVGCLGNLSVELVFHGESAHSARPWEGVNAVERAVAGLARLLPVPPRTIEVGRLPFVEVVSATRIDGGIAANVVPDRASCLLNYRYAPGRAPAEAEAQIRALAEAAGADEVAIRGNSQPAPVVADAPLVRRLRQTGRFGVAPKQAWTPVAEFAAVGLDAVNLGPGATRFAHRRDEQVEITALVRTYEALQRFLSSRETALYDPGDAPLPSPRGADDVSVRPPRRG